MTQRLRFLRPLARGGFFFRFLVGHRFVGHRFSGPVLKVERCDGSEGLGGGAAYDGALVAEAAPQQRPQVNGPRGR